MPQEYISCYVNTHLSSLPRTWIYIAVHFNTPQMIQEDSLCLSWCAKQQQGRVLKTMSLSNIWHHLRVLGNIASSIIGVVTQRGVKKYVSQCEMFAKWTNYLSLIEQAGICGAWQLYGHIGRHLTFVTVDRRKVWQAWRDDCEIENKGESMSVCVYVSPGLESFVLYVFSFVCESAQASSDWRVLYAWLIWEYRRDVARMKATNLKAFILKLQRGTSAIEIREGVCSYRWFSGGKAPAHKVTPR